MHKTFFKQETIRNKEWLNEVRNMPCVVCQFDKSDPAHIRIGTDGGTSKKPSDKYVLPLCHEHHEMQHRMGEKSFWFWVITRDKNFMMKCVVAFAEKLYNTYKENKQ